MPKLVLAAVPCPWRRPHLKNCYPFLFNFPIRIQSLIFNWPRMAPSLSLNENMPNKIGEGAAAIVGVP